MSESFRVSLAGTRPDRQWIGTLMGPPLPAWVPFRRATEKVLHVLRIRRLARITAVDPMTCTITTDRLPDGANWIVRGKRPR